MNDDDRDDETRKLRLSPVVNPVGIKGGVTSGLG